MDEELKYFKIEGTNTILAINAEDVEKAIQKFRDKSFELTECERPKDAEVRMEAPNIEPPKPFILRNPYKYFGEPRISTAFYSGPNCDKCANRFRRNDWCDQHYMKAGNCYRFKYKP